MTTRPPNRIFYGRHPVDDTMAGNTMRFDVRLPYVYPMIKGGEANVPDLASKLREAIVAVLDQEIGPIGQPVVSLIVEDGTNALATSKGHGDEGEFLYRESISYALD